MNPPFAIAALVFINVLWGSTYAVAKAAMTQMPPTLLAATRFTLATAVLWLLVFGLRMRGRGGGLDRVRGGDRWRLLALGALGIGFAYTLDYTGINLTTATDASLMIIGEVIFTTLLAALLVRERLGLAKLLGVLVGAAGVAVLVLGHVTGEGGEEAGVARAAGDLLILAALAMQALYTVLGTEQSRRYHPLTVVTWAYTGSLVVWLPLFGWHLARGPLPVLDGWAWLGVMHLSLVASVFCFLVWFGISRHVGAGVAALSLFVQPLVGAALGVLLLGDPMTFSTVLGGLLVLVSIVLCARAARA